MAEFSLKKLKNRVSAADKTYNANWREGHREKSHYIMPERGRFRDEEIPNDGKKRFDKVVDHTAGLDAGRAAAALFDGLTPTTRKWKLMQSRRKDLMELPDVKFYFEEVNRVIDQEIHDSNFYNNMADFFEEVTVFNIASLFIEGNSLGELNFSTFTCGEYNVVQNSKQIIDRWYRHYSDTVDNIIEKFGKENVSKQVAAKEDKSGDTYVDLVHAVEPNRGRDVTKLDNRNMPFMSIYYEKGCSDLEEPLRVSGYEEMPVIIGRWKTVGTEAYGSGPSDRALGATKGLQEVEKDIYRANKKIISPAMNVDDRLKGKKIGPGTHNYYNVASGAPQASAIYQITYDIEGNLLLGDKLRDALGKIFNSDLFSAISGIDRTQMTATEVAQRVAESTRLLVSVITRMISEVLKPALERIYNILERAGKFPDLPDALDGEELDILFISSLALAQQAIGLAGVEQVVDAAGRLAALKPEVLDKLNADQALDEIHRMSGAPEGIINSDEDVQIKREADQALENQARLAEQLSQMSEGAERLGNTPMNQDTALDTVVGGLRNDAP